MPQPRALSRAQAVKATRESLVLAAACLVAYWIESTLLSRLSSVPHDDDLLGGMWAVIAAITTTVIMVVAAISPQDAWHQPILRLADTVIGVSVGVAAAWLDLRVTRRDR
ncbi:MAG TPA: hypothetical protein VGG83_09805 [Trebonia sp.]|jgi:hypothetical protein